MFVCVYMYIYTQGNTTTVDLVGGQELRLVTDPLMLNQGSAEAVYVSNDNPL